MHIQLFASEPSGVIVQLLPSVCVCRMSQGSKGASLSGCYGATVGCSTFVEWVQATGCTTPCGVAAAISPVCFSTTKRAILKEHSRMNVFLKTFLKMVFHPCISGCGRYLAPGDGHDRSLTCLGIKQIEVAFVDESYSHCRKIRPSRSCGPGSTTSKGVEFCCLCHDLVLLLAEGKGGVLLAVAWAV